MNVDDVEVGAAVFLRTIVRSFISLNSLYKFLYATSALQDAVRANDTTCYPTTANDLSLRCRLSVIQVLEPLGELLVRLTGLAEYLFRVLRRALPVPPSLSSSGIVFGHPANGSFGLYNVMSRPAVDFCSSKCLL